MEALIHFYGSSVGQVLQELIYVQIIHHSLIPVVSQSSKVMRG